jgi:gamma-carbonic anhydrase
VPESAYVAPSAVLCGAVVVGERACILHGAVLTAEDGEVRTGEHIVIMEMPWFGVAEIILRSWASLC